MQSSWDGLALRVCLLAALLLGSSNAGKSRPKKRAADVGSGEDSSQGPKDINCIPRNGKQRLSVAEYMNAAQMGGQCDVASSMWSSYEYEDKNESEWEEYQHVKEQAREFNSTNDEEEQENEQQSEEPAPKVTNVADEEKQHKEPPPVVQNVTDEEDQDHDFSDEFELPPPEFYEPSGADEEFHAGDSHLPSNSADALLEVEDEDDVRELTPGERFVEEDGDDKDPQKIVDNNVLVDDPSDFLENAATVNVAGEEYLDLNLDKEFYTPREAGDIMEQLGLPRDRWRSFDKDDDHLLSIEEVIQMSQSVEGMLIVSGDGEEVNDADSCPVKAEQPSRR